MFGLNWKSSTDSFSESGKEGVIDGVLEPMKEWRIKVHGVYWNARSIVNSDFEPGERISVIGRRDLKLLIARM
jgi:membrane protein implicated in regulation of membrane protease activity